MPQSRLILMHTVIQKSLCGYAPLESGWGMWGEIQGSQVHLSLPVRDHQLTSGVITYYHTLGEPCLHLSWLGHEG